MLSDGVGWCKKIRRDATLAGSLHAGKSNTASEENSRNLVDNGIENAMICGGREFVWGSRTYVMGVVNVTPDSFSGDGLAGRTADAVEQAVAFEAEGADIIDVGAESTRPGHAAVSVEQELSRLLPVLEGVIGAVSIPVSVDTYKPEVASRAVEWGVSMINDVWGPRVGEGMAEVAAETGFPLVLMHNQVGTEYVDLVREVAKSLRLAARMAQSMGVHRERIILDPGIGFGKTADHNLEILNRLGEFKDLGFPLLVGTSRKSTIGLVLDLPVKERLEGTAATVALAIAGGADIVRVHDVREMTRVVRMSDAIVRGWRPKGWSR